MVIKVKLDSHKIENQFKQINLFIYITIQKLPK